MQGWRYHLAYRYTKWRCTLRYLLLPKNRNGKLALHCMFRNEAPFLAEWLAYHFSLGVDRIFLTNDHSSDQFRAVLAPFVAKGLVVLEEARRDLDFYAREEWHKNKVLYGSGRQFQWLGFLDSDEFIFLPTGELKAHLQKHTKQAGVVLNWFMYGTAHREDLAAGESLLEQLNRRFPDGHRENYSVKSIVQPAMGLRFFNHNPHYPQYSPLCRLVWSDGRRFRPAEKRILRSPLSINHYWYRTENFYRKVKRARRRFFEGSERSALLEQWHRERSNAVFEPFPPQRLAAMRAWRQAQSL